MAKATKVPKIRAAGKEARVRELVAEEKTSREIAAILAEEGLTVSHTAVTRFLREEAEERRDAARSVAASDAQESVPLVTKSLRRLIEKGMHRAARTKDDRDFARLGQMVTQACRALHHVTVGDDDAPREALDRLAEMVWGKGGKR